MIDESFIDTHAHLYLKQFAVDITEVIKRAQNTGIKKIFLPNIDSSTTSDLQNLVQAYPDLCFPMAGLHPCSVKADTLKHELEHFEKEITKENYVAVGETGIDLHWDTTFKNQQIEAFEFQIEKALELDFPIIIHSRESLDLTIECIAKKQNGHLKGIFHCFNGDKTQAKKIMDLDFKMGLGGVITFKKANLDEVVEYIEPEFIVLETDAPYLSPVPHRGKRNESSFIGLIAQKVAEIKKMDISEVAYKTNLNAENLFLKGNKINY